MFDPARNKQLKALVNDWDNSKFLPDRVLDMNPLSKASKAEAKENKASSDYSGANM